MFKKLMLAALAVLSFSALSARSSGIMNQINEGTVTGKLPKNQNEKVVVARTGSFIVHFATNDKETPNVSFATAGASTIMAYDGRLEGLQISSADVTNGTAEANNEANLILRAGEDDSLLAKLQKCRTFEIRRNKHVITVHPLN